jgi:hypothetical protein
MNNGFKHLWLAGCVAALLTTSARGDATIYMRAVEINGSFILPTDEVTVNPGDTITINFFMEGWAPALLRAYQASTDADGLHSGPCGSIGLASFTCADDGDCLGVSECLDGICNDEAGIRCDVAAQDCATGWSCDGDEDCFGLTCGVNGYCEVADCVADPGGSACDCFASAFIDESRADYVFYQQAWFGNSNCKQQNAALGYIGVGAVRYSGGQEDTGVAKYIGTLILKVSDDACGDFTLGIAEGIEYTFARDPDSIPIEPIDTSSTVLVHTGMVPCTIVSSDPPNCAVDARQPHHLDDSTIKYGWESVDLTFSCDPVASGIDDPSDFTRSQVPIPLPSAPTIQSVTDLGGNTLRIQFSQPINPERWFCVALASDANEKVCLGYLPADADSDLTAAPADILKVIDHLNDVDIRPVYSVDMDRDGDPGPADILRVIDLLNGASEFIPWLDHSLVDCPTG